MSDQNFKNHIRIVPAYHIVAFAAILFTLIGSVVNLVTSTRQNLYSASLILALTLIISLLFAFIRSFPIKAQDRAIRAEENLRHFILTGKALPPSLGIKQIIALRFADDEEFPGLVSEATSKSLSPKQIKQAVRSWKADHHRV